MNNEKLNIKHDNELPVEINQDDLLLTSPQVNEELDVSQENEENNKANNKKSKLCIIAKQPNGKVIKHDLEEGIEIVIGASSDCDVLVFDDDFLSGKHFAVKLDDGNIRVRDLNSTNGLHLRIDEHDVSKDQELLAGVTSFTFEECDE